MTTQATLYAMFLLGVFGTGHCIGMCGPLVVAFPAQTGRFSAHLWYHAGRLCTYGVVGALMGGVGIALAGAAGLAGVDPLSRVARWQVAFSMLAAIFLLVFGLARLGILREPAWMAWTSPERWPLYRKMLALRQTRRQGLAMFGLGLLLGFLPCGLSYAAFARALAAGGMLQGAMLVAAFGLGTVPGLILIGSGASHVARRYRRHSDLLAGVLMVAMGVVLGLDALQALMGAGGRAA